LRVSVEESAFATNDRIAAETRRRLAERRVLAVNLLSAPGSGKTSLLEATIDRLRNAVRIGVIEGDVATTRDADRVAAHGVPAVQVNTEMLSATCHLDARMVAQALERLPSDRLDLLLIENVGNLVCPAAFDLGEDLKVAVLSVTEGDDKPVKYPKLFREAAVTLISKMDLLPHCGGDVEAIVANLRAVQPAAEIIRTSVRTGEGLDAWAEWLHQRWTAKCRSAD